MPYEQTQRRRYYNDVENYYHANENEQIQYQEEYYEEDWRYDRFHSQYHDYDYETAYHNKYQTQCQYQHGDGYYDDCGYQSYDDGESWSAETEFFEEPSPLNLKQQHHGKYIKKQAILPHIVSQIKQIQNTNQTTQTLDVRANAAKTINAWNQRINLCNGIKQAFENNNHKKINILEIGCNNANNLQTFIDNGTFIQNYVGIDSTPADKVKCDAFDIEFVCDDIFKSDDVSIANGKQFDLINVDLSMLHRAFASSLTMMRFLKFLNIFSNQSHCVFVCNFVCDTTMIERWNKISARNSILNILCDKNESFDIIAFENRYQRISIHRGNLEKICQSDDAVSKLGIDYRYYQMHSLDNIREYFVCFAYFIKMMTKHANMELIYRYNAKDIFEKYRSQNEEMNSAFKRCSEDERQVIDTYGFALFQRKE